MAETKNEGIQTNPVALVQEIGEFGENFLREVGSMFWFIAHTFEETFDRIRQGRVPFRAASFFRHTERAGVASVPLVGLVSFFLGLTMLLAGVVMVAWNQRKLGLHDIISGTCVVRVTVVGAATAATAATRAVDAEAT